MSTLVVSPSHHPLVGSVPVPSDKSVGHRALLFGAIAEGTTHIEGFAPGGDNLSTAQALRAMGVDIAIEGASAIVKGVGLYGLVAPTASLDCGNSGTTMRLLSGLLAAQDFKCSLHGDESLSRRPMMRVLGPLRSRGALVDGTPHPTKQGEITAPLSIGPLTGDSYLGPIEYENPVASAQVKSALLLSGLYAHGVTLVREPHVSRDHTERMLHAMGAPLETFGTLVRLDPAGWDGKLAAQKLVVPGDVSAAAFLLVAAQLVSGSRVTVRHVGTNPTRTGILEILRDMQAGVHVEAKGEVGGEPVAEVHLHQTPTLVARMIGGETVTRAIDEVPIACALAARASGRTRIRDAAELRVKESDRLATMATVLRAFGVKCEELPDGIDIEGTDAPLRAAVVESHGDHRIAMTAAVLGLIADGPTRIRDADCITTSFPKFVGTLRALGAEVSVEA